MSIGSAMNGVAWGLCAVLAGAIARDFIRVERAARNSKPRPDPKERQD